MLQQRICLRKYLDVIYSEIRNTVSKTFPSASLCTAHTTCIVLELKLVLIVFSRKLSI